MFQNTYFMMSKLCCRRGKIQIRLNLYKAHFDVGLEHSHMKKRPNSWWLGKMFTEIY